MAKSSKQWLRRHVTDPYVRMAKEQGYRSRAAFKLLDLDAREKLLAPGQLVVDLGAAPGGWSQVAAGKVAPGGRVVAVDLLDIAPIKGVELFKGDFRQPAVLEALQGRKADAILSDLAPNLSGIALVDQAKGLELALAALHLCTLGLKPGGVFVVKAFQGEAFKELLAAMKEKFDQVKVVKPTASRGESAETYVVARSLFGAAKTA
jgi:23S rRNA (uridine2552-2'-O)-methyltransferase